MRSDTITFARALGAIAAVGGIAAPLFLATASGCGPKDVKSEDCNTNYSCKCQARFMRTEPAYADPTDKKCSPTDTSSAEMVGLADCKKKYGSANCGSCANCTKTGQPVTDLTAGGCSEYNYNCQCDVVNIVLEYVAYNPLEPCGLSPADAMLDATKQCVAHNKASSCACDCSAVQSSSGSGESPL